MNHPLGQSAAWSRICGLALALWVGLMLVSGTGLQAQPLAFRHFDDRDGLPQSQVRCMFEDRDGFIWMGTMEGLARLGASGFRPYRDVEGLLVKQINCITQDRHGSIWVGGPDSGVAEIRGSRIRNFGTEEGLAAKTVYTILERRNGDLLAGARQGLFCKKGDRFERVELPEPTTYLPIYCMEEDARGDLWMGSRRGNLFRWDGKKVFNALLPPALADKPVQTIVRGPDGSLWALFPQALLHQSGRTEWEPFKLPALAPQANFIGLSFSPDGEMLLAMGQDGLLVIDKGHSKLLTHKDGLPREGVTMAKRDRRGVLWICSDGSDALAQAIPDLRSLDTDPETGIGLGLGAITTFFELSPTRILLGGSRGLQLWEEGRGITNRWQTFAGLTTMEVWSLAAHPQGGVWVGTSKGLWRWKDGKILAGPKRLEKSYIFSLLVHADRLWVCTQGDGLAEVSNSGEFIAFHTLPQEVGKGDVVKVLPRVFPRGPGLLVATDVGLYNFRVEGGHGSFTRAKANTPVQAVNIFTMYEEESGPLWVGTRDGVYEFPKDKVGEWKLYGGLKSGIQGSPNWIQRLPEGQLAVGHAKGVSILSEGSLVQLTKNRGLLSDETTQDAVLLDSRGRLWIGMKGGACILDTRRPFLEVRLPKPRVMEARWGKESRWLPNQIELPPLPGTLDLVFDTGLPASPVVPRYEAMIEGLDRTWRAVEINADSIQVAQVGPGKYAFRLRASLDGHQWVESEPLPIRVRPAWHQRLVTRILLGLVAAGLILCLVYWRLKSLEKRAHMLEAKVQERTESLALRNRSQERLHQQLKRSLESRVHLMRTVSHDLRSPLTSIMLSVDRIRESDGEQISASMLNVLDKEARRLEGIIRGLLDQAKTEAFTDSLNQRLCRITEVLDGLTDTLRLKAESRGLTTHLELDPNADSVWILADTTALQQVLFNLIENALKFTEPPGTIGIRSLVGEDNWALEVWDTGRGIDSTMVEDIFQAFRQTQEGDAKTGWGLGLNICKTLVEAHSGRIEVVSEVGKGSTFRVILPLVLPNKDSQES
ncbi:MAG: hypothetical protein IPN59_01290 [Holophaga sp.]|nr:hypothetical protein [Holophaga sp.]